MKHHSVNGDGLPTDEEIRAWYKQQPSGVLLRYFEQKTLLKLG